MAFDFIPYQPVIFDPLINNKNYLGNYLNRPKLSNTDVHQFAVGFTEAENILEQVANNSFNSNVKWNDNGSWAVGSGRAEYTGGPGPLVTQDIVFYPGIFIFEVTVEDLTAGSIQPNAGASPIGLPITENGNFGSFYFSLSNENLNFTTSGLNVGAKITVTSVTKFVDETFACLFWDDNTKIADLTKTLSSASIFTMDYNTDPTSGVYGCVKYGVNNDFQKQVLDQPGFAVQGDWTDSNISGSTVSNFPAYGFEVVYSSSNAIHSLTQTGVLEIGQEYTININFNNKAILQNLYNFSEAGDPVIPGPYGDIVTHTFIADSTDFELRFENDATFGTIGVRWIEMYQTPYDNGNYTYSNVFEYGPNNLSTILLEWTNNERIFNLPFGVGIFNLSLRLCAKVIAPEYNSEREITDTIEGVRYKRYFKTDKNETLVIEPQTQEIHDAISRIGACSTFKIDGVLYEVNQEDYQPDWNENDDNFAPAELKVVRVPVSETAVRCVSGPNRELDSNYVE